MTKQLIELWNWTVGVDSRAILRWAADELELADDIRDLIKAIQDDTKSVMVAENQLVPLLEIGVAAGNSGTYHAISADRFKKSIRDAFKAKPVEFKPDPPEKKPKQKSMF